LICVPGLGLDARAWAPTLDRLPEWSHEVAPLPGYGIRPRRGEAIDPQSLGRRLAEERLTDRGGLVLLGHSASCHVVVEAAAAAPGAVTAVVLVGPTTDPTARSWPALAQRWLRTARHEDPRQLPLLARSYSRVGIVTMLRSMGAARTHDLRIPLGALTCPVLVVRGRDDRICPADWAAEVAASAPAASRTASLPVGGHMVPLTHGAATADVVRAFLDAGGHRHVAPRA
jgi:pimeloyl-ACP methyl ester carboxylesterase